MENMYDWYVKGLIIEIEKIAVQSPGCCLESIFIGGGTPTVLQQSQLIAILEAIYSNFSVHVHAECTIEANPETVDRSFLESLRENGLNRISFGVQSFKDDHLKLLGRVHSSDTAIRAVCAAHHAGFANINIDLMYAIPGQQRSDHQQNLEKAISLPVTHISVYELTIEENTPFSKRFQKDSQYYDEDEVAAMDELTVQLLEKAGLYRYEISNYCRTGYRCRHNLTYWRNEEYLGVGAAAVSYVDGRRKRNESSILKYCQLTEMQGSAQIECEELSVENSFRETVVMGLRLLEGVSKQRLQNRFSVDLSIHYGERLAALEKKGLVDWNNSRLSLTPEGLKYANQVMAELV